MLTRLTAAARRPGGGPAGAGRPGGGPAAAGWAGARSTRAVCMAALVVGAVLLLALPRQLQDLDVYRAGGLAVAHGRDPYAVTSGPSALPFTYPPFAAALAVPLAVVPRWLAALALMAAGGASLAVVARWLRLPVLPTVAGAALLMEPVRSTFAYGQVNLVLMGVVVADLAVWRQRRTSGVLTGLAAAVKLTPLVFLGWLAVTRQWRRLCCGITGFVVAGGVTAILDPDRSSTYWRHYARDSSRIGSAAYGSNQAFSGLLARLQKTAVPHGGTLASVLLGAAGLLIAGAVARRDRDLSLCLAALTGLVASPISWSHHWVWVLPAGVLLVRRGGRDAPAQHVGAQYVGVLLLGVTVVGLPSWWDRGGNREYARGWLDLVFGETYLAAGVLALSFVCLRLLLAEREEIC